MSNIQHNDEPAPQEFASVLVQADKGRIHGEASTRLAEVVRAVRETGKAGRIQVTLDIKPDKGSGGERVVIAATVTAKTPAFDPRTSIFFTDDDGGLHRTDPQQHDLFDTQETPNR